MAGWLGQAQQKMSKGVTRMAHTVAKMSKSVVVLLVLAAAMLLSQGQPTRAAEGVVVRNVNGAFGAVVAKFRRQIAAHKLVIVKEVPYQQMLSMVGLKTEKVVGFEIFHPRFGKVIYQNDRSAMKDVPLRVVVRETGSSKVQFEYRKPSAVFAGYSGLSGLGKQLDKVFASVVERTSK